MADEEGVAFTCPARRQSHHSGDWQSLINSLVFARQNGSEIAVKLSQRLIPVLPEFWSPMLEAFSNPEVMVVVPGRLDKRQVARPSSVFFTKFPLLTDVVAMRSTVEPELLLSTYRDRFNKATTHHDVLVEFALNHLILNHFKEKTVTLWQWSRHEVFKPKLYLRKSQSIPAEYASVAAMENLTGNWNLNEWAVIERGNYACRPTKV